MRLGNSLKHAGKNFISTSSQVCLFLDIQIGGFMYVLRVQIPSKGTGISCDPYPRISCDPTHARDQLRPYPQEFYGRVNVFYLYQGSAVTLPDFSVKNPTGFCTVSRLFRFKYNIPFIKFSPPPWQPMLCDPT